MVCNRKRITIINEKGTDTQFLRVFFPFTSFIQLKKPGEANAKKKLEKRDSATFNDPARLSVFDYFQLYSNGRDYHCVPEVYSGKRLIRRPGMGRLEQFPICHESA
ncbi:hypothetical protein D3C87_1714910 [compost metagenome]